MTPTIFEGQSVVIAEHQDEYLPLPAHVDPDGVVTCCWQLTWRERVRLLLTGKLWHQVMTFHRPLQPQMLHVSRPESIGGP